MPVYLHDIEARTVIDFTAASLLGIRYDYIENKYGHFKDSLTRYISIIDESQSRMSQLYNEMDAKKKETLSVIPQIGTGASGDKKVMS